MWYIISSIFQKTITEYFVRSLQVYHEKSPPSVFCSAWLVSVNDSYSGKPKNIQPTYKIPMCYKQRIACHRTLCINIENFGQHLKFSIINENTYETLRNWICCFICVEWKSFAGGVTKFAQVIVIWIVIWKLVFFWKTCMSYKP